MKKFRKILIILVIVIAVLVLAFFIASRKIVSDANALPIAQIDLTQIKDGEYLGKYEIFPVRVSVKVVVKDGKITQIDLVEHFNGRGGAAEKITDSIIEKQSLQVDSVTGATVSSVTIKKAVEDAFHSIR